MFSNDTYQAKLQNPIGSIVEIISQPFFGVLAISIEKPNPNEVIFSVILHINRMLHGIFSKSRQPAMEKILQRL